MNKEQNQAGQDAERLKEIPKWTRKYVENRTLTILVLMVMLMFFSMFIAALVGFSLALAVTGFRKGNIVLGCVGIAVLVAVLAATVKSIIIFLSKFGGKNRGLIDQLIEQRIYGKDGTVSMPQPKLTKKKKWLESVAGVVFFICVLGTIYLGMEGYIALKYVQPVMAMYFVPFQVFEYFLQRPRLGPLLLICPILYTVHAILIVAGVPIYFRGDLGIIWNMFLPAVGYTSLAYVIGHVYSRYALKKLKGLTHLEGEAANGD
jgi:hypothetical protein